MGSALNILSSIVTLGCAVVLLRGFASSRARLLLWSGLCFVALSFSNLMVFVDLVVFPETDLYLVRLGSAAAAMLLMVFGLVWESSQ